MAPAPAYLGTPCGSDVSLGSTAIRVFPAGVFRSVNCNEQLTTVADPVGGYEAVADLQLDSRTYSAPPRYL